MADNDDEPDPIITRSITINEMMDADGGRWISIDTEGTFTEWDALGILAYAAEWYRADARKTLANLDDE